jgi:hypothetical protein
MKRCAMEIPEPSGQRKVARRTMSLEARARRVITFHESIATVITCAAKLESKNAYCACSQTKCAPPSLFPLAVCECRLLTHAPRWEQYGREFVTVSDEP